MLANVPGGGQPGADHQLVGRSSPVWNRPWAISNHDLVLSAGWSGCGSAVARRRCPRWQVTGRIPGRGPSRDGSVQAGSPAAAGPGTGWFLVRGRSAKGHGRPRRTVLASLGEQGRPRAEAPSRAAGRTRAPSSIRGARCRSPCPEGLAQAGRPRPASRARPLGLLPRRGQAAAKALQATGGLPSRCPPTWFSRSRPRPGSRAPGRRSSPLVTAIQADPGPGSGRSPGQASRLTERSPWRRFCSTGPPSRRRQRVLGPGVPIPLLEPARRPQAVVVGQYLQARSRRPAWADFKLWPCRNGDGPAFGGLGQPRPPSRFPPPPRRPRPASST